MKMKTKIKTERIVKMYFSPTGTTEKVVSAIADCLGQELGCPVVSFDFTLPRVRIDEEGKTCFPSFIASDLVVFGCPTYAGRLPNLLLKYLQTIKGNRAAAIPVVTFGNRNYDNSLIELRDILVCCGFLPVGAAACSCEHSFSRQLGAGRPDETDLGEIRDFALKLSKEMDSAAELPPLLSVPGIPASENYGGYYQPRDRNGVFIDIRKVKPQTDPGKCLALSSEGSGCSLCAQVCPMGAIDFADISQVPGICIKCGACMKKCPAGAKYYTDSGYLYHKSELEEMYTRRAENHFFL